MHEGRENVKNAFSLQMMQNASERERKKMETAAYRKGFETGMDFLGGRLYFIRRLKGQTPLGVFYSNEFGIKHYAFHIGTWRLEYYRNA